MKSGFAEGVAAVLVAVVLWGSQLPVAKDVFSVVDPFMVTAIRYGFGALFLVAFCAWREGAPALRYYGRFWPATLAGVIGMCLSPLLVFVGMSLSSPEHAAIIIALQPSMTALAGWAVRGRRPAKFTIGCVALAFGGVVVAVTRGDPALMHGKNVLAGDLVVLAGAICWVTFTMAIENFKGWSALRFTTLTLIPGALASVAIAAVLLAAGITRSPGAAALVSVGWQLSYLTFGGVVVAMLCWSAGNQRIGALNSMLLVNFLPVVTFAVRFAQGHRFEAIELAGALIVIGALVANNLYLRRVAEPPPPR